MKIQGLMPAGVINIKELANILSNFKVGSKISAQVISLNGNELTLRFSDGTNVNATSIIPLDISLGDIIDLSIKSKSDSQVVLETVKNTAEETKSNEVIDTLACLKLPPNERNIEIGRALTNQHVALNKENFAKVINVLSDENNKNMKIDKAVFIISNNLDNIDDGIKLLDGFEKNQTQLGKTLEKLISTISFVLKDRDIVQIIDNYNENIVTKSNEKQNNEIKSIINDYHGLSEENRDIFKSIVKSIINQSSTSNNSNNVINNLVSKQINENDIDNLLKYINNNELTKFLDENPNLKLKINDNFNNKTELKNIVSEFNKENASNPKQILHENVDLQHKIRALFKDNVNIIKGNRIKNEIDVNKLFEDILDKVNIIEKHLEDNGIISTSSKSEVIINDVKNQISFMKNIDNLFSFYQIPIVINQKETTVDLYFVKNSKEHKKIDAENASIFISLNTSNLGVVETLIHVKYDKIDLNFRLEDDKTIQFFEKKQGELEKLLEDKGYFINKVKYAISTKRTNIRTFEHLLKDSKNIVKDVFDVKV